MRPLVLLLSGALAGCIIYEEKYTTTTDTQGSDPDPQGTQLTDALELTVTEGLPGESVLTNLVPVGSGFDVSKVVAVNFERDIQTADLLVRDFEVVLLLNVASTAAPGEVEVRVHTSDSRVWVLTRPFDILAPVEQPTGDTGSEPTGPTGDTGSDPTGDTGTSTTPTGDTGAPEPTGDTATPDTGSEPTGDTGAPDTGAV